MNVAGGSTNVTTYFVLRLKADGTEATGLTITDLDLQYCRSGSTPAAKADATALAATDTAHTDNYAIEIDATDQPGLYRVDWPDAAFAAGVPEVILTLKHTSCFTEHLRVSIDAPVDPGAALIETGVTLKQALQRIGATTAGVSAGAENNVESFKGIGVSTVRAVITTDANSNRTGVAYDP